MLVKIQRKKVGESFHEKRRFMRNLVLKAIKVKRNLTIRRKYTASIEDLSWRFSRQQGVQHSKTQHSCWILKQDGITPYCKEWICQRDLSTLDDVTKGNSMALYIGKIYLFQPFFFSYKCSYRCEIFPKN